jgi:hypothetical protein
VPLFSAWGPAVLAWSELSELFSVEMIEKLNKTKQKPFFSTEMKVRKIPTTLGAKCFSF